MLEHSLSMFGLFVQRVVALTPKVLSIVSQMSPAWTMYVVASKEKQVRGEESIPDVGGETYSSPRLRYRGRASRLG